MKFRLINENTRGLYTEPSQDLVNEELLTEDKLYKVDVNGSNKVFYFFAGDNVNKFTSMTQCDMVYNYIEDTLRKSGHEKVNTALMNQLQALGTTSARVTDISAHKSAITAYKKHTQRLLNTTYSPSRAKSHSNVASSIGNINTQLFTDLTVHHLDGSEYNDSDDNLIGFDNNTLHQLAHILPMTISGTGKYTWSRRFNAAVYDGTDFVIKPCRVTMEIR